MSKITATVPEMQWKNKSISDLTLEELGHAQSYVNKTIKTLQEGERQVQTLLPKYKSNPTIVNRFSEFLMTITVEIAKRTTSK